ncbi:hypothetical protein ERD78_05295 [Allopusillimonas soli]|uniref:TauD/TfdA family dioxygenase n=1 Tax=Allopusillimonas soli TaxID=659016 RepID=A0A853F8K1_9BURK|nr:TauD/TfdA family dioxygenase [Allopusillimonas soli]NYT36279.1 TauD/TfdA family dioxygenase [Allopusillimonas soli]TEA76603.1 hypothetical protein ERD78_05295 [Allopusillimonas soli]
MTILQEPIPMERAWVGSRLRKTDEWITPLTNADLAGIESALHAVSTRGLKWGEFDAASFPIGSLADKLSKISHDLRHGRGFVLLRGVPVEKYTLEEIQIIYWGLGSHLGTIVSQNAKGTLIEHITDKKPANLGDPNLRSYVTNEGQPPHSDQSDIVSLLCVDRALKGGESVVVSSLAIYNRILAEHPEYLLPLYEGYYHDLRGEGESGDINETSDVPVPVFSNYNDQFRAWFHSKKMRNGSRKKNVALSPLQIEAMKYIETLGQDPELRLDMQLEPGDIQLLNNYSALHYRHAFVDGQGHKRLMLRLWIEMADMGDFDPVMERWVRQGIPQRAWSKNKPVQALGNV